MACADGPKRKKKSSMTRSEAEIAGAFIDYGNRLITDGWGLLLVRMRAGLAGKKVSRAIGQFVRLFRACKAQNTKQT